MTAQFCGWPSARAEPLHRAEDDEDEKFQRDGKEGWLARNCVRLREKFIREIA